MVAGIDHKRLLDLLDYDRESGEFRWKHGNCWRIKAGDRAGYARKGRWWITIEGREYQASRLAWFYVHGEWPLADLDHRDLDKMNNRIANLRPATRSQNMANGPLPVSNRSGFKGVTWNRRRGRWQAQIKKDRKMHYLGLFADPAVAHAAYIQAAERLFGEFARAA